MVRTIDKIYAEVNDEDTVTIEFLTYLLDKGLIVGNDNKKIKFFRPDSQYGSIIYQSDGVIQKLDIEPNKLLGTDNDGNLVWL